MIYVKIFYSKSLTPWVSLFKYVRIMIFIETAYQYYIEYWVPSVEIYNK